MGDIMPISRHGATVLTAEDRARLIRFNGTSDCYEGTRKVCLSISRAN